MSLTPEDVKKIGQLAQLNLSAEDLAYYTPQLTHILSFVDQMNTVDTSKLQPTAHPLDLVQRLRADLVTETNQREVFQALAPEVKAGLYLVPKVIEEA